MSHIPSDTQRANTLVRVDEIEVGVPRGLRDATASLKVAGQLRRANGDGRPPKKDLVVPVKTYTIKVAPGAHNKKIKDKLREQARPVSELDWYDSQTQQGPDDRIRLPEVLDRSCFRRDRVKKIAMGRQFPALINPRLFPAFSPKAGHETDGRSSPEYVSKERLVLPTVSTACKKQMKKMTAAMITWKNGTSSEAQQLISNRQPALHVDPYEMPRLGGTREYHTRKSRASSTSPTLRMMVQATDDAKRQALESEIVAKKERGREGCEELQARYDAKRTNFIKERDAELQRRGCFSPFEYARRKYREQEQLLEDMANQEGKDEANVPDIMNRMSIGFSRFRGEK